MNKYRIIAILLMLFIFAGNCFGLTLNEAINEALDHNFGLQAARYDSASARQEYIRAKSLRWPELTMDGRAGYVSDLPSFEIDLPVGQPISREIGSQENYQFDLRLSAPIFTGGRVSGSIAAAEAKSLAAGFNLEATRLEVAYRTRRAYLSVMLAQSGVDITEASFKRLQIIAEDVGNLFDNGLADSIDILEASLALERERQALIEQKTRLKNARESMNNLIGATGEINGDVASPPNNPPAPTLIHEKDYFVKRPELSRLEMLADAAESRERMERAAYFPDLIGYAGYSVGKPNRDMFENDWDDYFSAGIMLRWNLNLGIDNSTKAASQTARSARMNKKDIEDRLRLISRTAMNDLEQSFELIELSRREFELARRRFQLAEEKQQAGRLSVNRLLEMEAELTATEEKYISAIIRYYLAATEFYYATGSDKIFGGLQ